MNARRVSLFVFMSMLFVMPLAAHAQLGFPEQIVPKCGVKGICGLCDIVTLANNIVTALIYLSVFVATFLFAYAGFIYMSAGGEPGKISKAHDIFRNVLIGMVIVLVAWLVVDTIMHTLTGTKFGDSWSKIC